MSTRPPAANRPSPPVSATGGLVLGLTATRSGLTPEQGRVLTHILRGLPSNPIRELHHGGVYFSSRVTYNPSTP